MAKSHCWAYSQSQECSSI